MIPQVPRGFFSLLQPLCESAQDHEGDCLKSADQERDLRVMAEVPFRLKDRIGHAEALVFNAPASMTRFPAGSGSQRGVLADDMEEPVAFAGAFHVVFLHADHVETQGALIPGLAPTQVLSRPDLVETSPCLVEAGGVVHLRATLGPGPEERLSLADNAEVLGARFDHALNPQPGAELKEAQARIEPIGQEPPEAPADLGDQAQGDRQLFAQAGNAAQTVEQRHRRQFHDDATPMLPPAGAVDDPGPARVSAQGATSQAMPDQGVGYPAHAGQDLTDVQGAQHAGQGTVAGDLAAPAADQLSDRFFTKELIHLPAAADI